MDGEMSMINGWIVTLLTFILLDGQSLLVINWKVPDPHKRCLRRKRSAKGVLEERKEVPRNDQLLAPITNPIVVQTFQLPHQFP